uniref:Uncharacterized protein n=1 Tax=Arundo donax TaxID=35708 RepID=A0A0A8YMH4_ARUDO
MGAATRDTDDGARMRTAFLRGLRRPTLTLSDAESKQIEPLHGDSHNHSCSKIPQSPRDLGFRLSRRPKPESMVLPASTSAAAGGRHYCGSCGEAQGAISRGRRSCTQRTAQQRWRGRR